MNNLFSIFLICVFLSCSNYIDEEPTQKDSIIGIVNVGMVVYEPTFGLGDILSIKVSDNISEKSFIKVAFRDSFIVMIFDEYGEINYNNEKWRIQPSKENYYW